jgi:hypothetical protein
MLSGHIRRWIKKAFHCLALGNASRKFEREFDVELHGTDDDRELMARSKLRPEASGMVEIDRSVSRFGAAVREASVNRSREQFVLGCSLFGILDFVINHVVL